MNWVFLLDVHHTRYLTIILKRMANFLTDLLRSFPILWTAHSHRPLHWIPLGPASLILSGPSWGMVFAADETKKPS